MSQSPQTGQFNSYEHIMFIYIILCLISLNPLKRVNSILTASCYLEFIEPWTMSQSPQTGQFNSYAVYSQTYSFLTILESQSPQTGQFNSYRDDTGEVSVPIESLNPLKRVNSILTKSIVGILRKRLVQVSIPSNGSIQFLRR